MRNRKPEPYMVIGTTPGSTQYWLRLTGDLKHLNKLGRPLAEKGWVVHAEDVADVTEQAKAGGLQLVTNDMQLALAEMSLKRWVDSTGLQFSSLTEIVSMMQNGRPAAGFETFTDAEKRAIMVRVKGIDGKWRNGFGDEVEWTDDNEDVG